MATKQHFPYYLLFTLHLSLFTAFSQAVYLPVSHEVYPFLKRMEARQLLVNYQDAAKPLSRKAIASHLRVLEGSIGSMTTLERETYEFLKGEFQYELSSLAGDPEPSEIRWHLLSTEIPKGVLNLDFNGKLSQTYLEKDYVRLRSQGLKIYGTLYDNVGLYFNFVDNREVGNAINFFKRHTPEPGVVPTKDDAEILEYNTTEAQLSVQLGAFQLSLEKMQNVWGLGRRGNIIFSDKAPSYPQFKMRVPIASWLDFIYLHAELNSNLLDSTRSYPTNSSALRNYFRPVDRLKYMAAHQVEISIINGLDIALGESVVYSDRGPLLIYLIPVMFFKSAEHYNRDKDNTQLFFNADINLIRNFNIYGSLFIDDFNTDNILSSTKSINEVAYTVGLQSYDVPIRNLELLVEYSRLNPWVYAHKIPATNFSDNGYDLGHWIGQNADNVFVELSYKPIRSLIFGGSLEVYRKGGYKDIAFHYEKELPAPPFLYGPLREQRSYSFFGRYQFVRDGFLNVYVKTINLSDESLGLKDQKQLEFSVGVQYGVW